MLIPDKDQSHLKKWLAERLEQNADADSDILTDYVIALLMSEGTEEQLRQNCLEGLEDFVKDDTKSFVDEIFQALASKSYIPGYKPMTSTPKQPIPSEPRRAVQNQPDYRSQKVDHRPVTGRNNQTKKRGYVDLDAPGFNEPSALQRAPKLPRRGASAPNGRGGRVRGSFHGQASLSHAQRSGVPAGLPQMDPQNMFVTLMTMQAMGYPLPQLPGNLGDQIATMMSQMGSKQRCQDYDAKGFCAAGIHCPYEHGPEAMVMPPGIEGYDPTNPSSMTGSSVHRPQQPRRSVQPKSHNRGQHRASYTARGPSQDSSNTVLVVAAIPPKSYDEPSIRECFTAFGEIASVKLQDHTERVALVKFTNHTAAQKAYDSPKALFENRFVKVYWYKITKHRDHFSSSSVHTANDAQDLPQNEDYEVDPSDTAFQARQAVAQNAFEARRKKNEEAQLQREHVESQLREHTEEKKRLLKRIAEQTGEQVPADNTADMGGAGNLGANTKTEALRAQLAALEEEAKTMGINPDGSSMPSSARFSTFRGRGRGRGWIGSSTARGRGGFAGGRGGAVARLDNRPRSVSVSPAAAINFESDPKAGEALRTFLFEKGLEVAEVRFEYSASDDTTENAGGKDRAVLVFRERYRAEMFIDAVRVAGGVVVGLGKVELGWVANAAPSASAAGRPREGGVLDPAAGSGGEDEEGDEQAARSGDQSEEGGEEEGEINEAPPPPPQQRTRRWAYADAEDFDVAE